MAKGNKNRARREKKNQSKIFTDPILMSIILDEMAESKTNRLQPVLDFTLNIHWMRNIFHE